MAADMPADLAAAVRLGGEMGRRFAGFDWAAHPLGQPTNWPPEVRSAVAVALTSRFPIVLWLGADDLFLVYNDAYLPMLGDKHPAALGRRGEQAWWDIWPQIGPMLSGVVTTGQATWSHDLMLPLVNDGRPRERYFTFSYGPIIRSSGQVDGVFCAVNETTERVLGERRLHLLNAVAAAVMDARTVDDAVTAMVEASGQQHPDLPFTAVYLADPQDGATLRATTAEVVGLLPKYLTEIAGPPADAGSGIRVIDLDPLTAALASALGPSHPRQALVLPLGKADGQPVGDLLVGVNPWRPVDDLYRGFCRLLADQMAAALASADLHQQQQRRADALAELDRAKSAFLTNVSHEFRTPLTLLLGPLQDALDATAATEEIQRDRLSVARRNAQRLLRLVNSLLEFSRVEAGRAEASRAALDLGAVTAQISSSFAGLCERAGIDLVLDCSPVAAMVDVEMWETIVLNLLSNAIKFTYAGAITVKVTGTATGGSRLRVVDTGIGIAPEDLERLSERFYRATNTRGRTVEGSGIGLSLVRGLVELHGGTMDIDSTPDVGTTVTIDLPPAVDSDDPVTPDRLTGTDDGAVNAFVAEALQWLERPTDTPSPAASSGVGRALVLVVDDNADMRAHLERVLSTRWNTIAASDGESALRALRRHRPDLLVTDVMMPGLDGFGLVNAVRDDPELADTPVLMLSARAGAEATGEGLDRGADDYLVKPFTSVELVGRVEARLRGVAREREHRTRSEATARREAAVADMTAAVNGAESLPQLLSVLRAGPLEADAVAVGLLDEDRQYLTVYYDGPIDAELTARYHRISIDTPLPIAQVVATDQPMIMPDPGSLQPRYDDTVHEALPGIQAAVVYPLRDNSGTVIGALMLLWSQPASFPPARLELFVQAAAVVGPALARQGTITREHRIATDFQQHLLDLDRACTEVAVAASYQPATQAMQVGGDWYLSTPLGPGRIGVCVGDVVGHGLHAATVMGRLRAAVATSALATPDPRHVLTNVQRYAATVPGATCASLAYARLDTTSSTLDYVCAGHPYPLLVTPDGRARFLRDGRSPPLAAFGRFPDRSPGRTDFPAGSLLILYTDGLVERRGESINDGFARLAAASADCATMSTDLVCTTLLRRLEPVGGYIDDVVILALRPTGTTPTSWIATVPADADRLAVLRAQLRGWMTGLGLGTTSQQHILIGVGETIANAMEHGSNLDPTRTVTVEAFATSGQVTIAVRDSGQWRGDTTASRRDGGRGRGLTLMYGLADQVDIARTPHGTTVTLRYPRHTAADDTTGAQP